MADINTDNSIPGVEPQTDTPRMRALQNLSNQLPVANSRVAAGQQASQQMQLQNAVKAAPQGGSTVQSAQDTGTAMAQTTGQNTIQNAQNQVQQQGQLGQLGVGEQKAQAESNVASQTQGARQQQMDNLQRLSQIDQGAKQQLYDRQMQFQQDQNGRTMFSTEQLADYAKSTAQNQQTYDNYAQQAQQLSQRNLEAMQQAYKLVSEDLKQQAAVAEQKGDQVTAQTIYQQQRDASAAMSKAQSDAANNKSIWQASATAVGATVGGIISKGGAGDGAAAGSAIGSIGGG